MTEHTRGPWEVINEETSDNFRDSIYAEGFKGLLIARCNQNGQHGMDSKLLAAAPDLLEALEKIVVDEERRAKDLRHRKAWLPLKFSEERLEKARAAIKRAREG